MSVSLIALLLLALVYLVIWVKAIVEAARAPVRQVEKVVWLGVLLFFPLFGTIAWYLLGPRPSRVAAGRI